MTPRRVVVVDDSEVCRATLAEILEADGDIAVVGEAGDGASARTEVDRLRPDLVTMDIEMPGEDGLAVIEGLMATTPVPILVVTGAPTRGGGEVAFEAVHRGALELVAKPAFDDDAACAALRAMVRQLAGVPVVRHISSVSRAAAVRSRPASTHPPFVPSAERRPSLIAIGASAGGPAAVVSVLRQLPVASPPIGLVQHLPEGFVDGFARFLGTATRREVVVVAHDRPAAQGAVYVAADGHHLVVRRTGELGVEAGPPEGGHRPSVTRFMRSAAAVHGAAALGILLTGIGVDGVEGLLEMRAAGALTIAQDEASSAVYGMPRAAKERGAAERIVALDAIGAVVRARLVRSA